jgi:hypothetical protein
MALWYLNDDLCSAWLWSVARVKSVSEWRILRRQRREAPLGLRASLWADLGHPGPLARVTSQEEGPAMTSCSNGPHGACFQIWLGFWT